LADNRYRDDSHSLPIFGYRVVEVNRAIVAVQYFGGGIWGTNKCIDWIHQALEPDMKLLMAAAMTAVLEAKYLSGGFME
jgi:hypothetical protein